MSDLKSEYTKYGSLKVTTENGDEFLLKEDRGGLRVMSCNGLMALQPDVSNVVVIYPRRFGQ